MNIKGFAKVYRIVCLWLKVPKFLVLCMTVILITENAYAVRTNSIRYSIALSPNGSRVAVGKVQQGQPRELFEGVFQQPLHRVIMPPGLYSTGAFNYSPDGNDLMFAAMAGGAVEAVPADKRSQASDVERISTTESLWRQRLGNDGISSPSKIFEFAGINNVLPLLDGAIVFMGAVRRIRSHSPSPLFGGGHRVWTNYSWMLRKPDGSITAINPAEYAFYSTASLIRDEAVFFVQERYVNNRPLDPREYQLNITPLKPGADMSALARLGAMQDRRGGPRLQCDWAGRTCARIMTYDKDRYYAHHLEIIRDGKICKVSGLPDRLEKFSISRSGNAVALVTRPNPYRDVGYQLVRIMIDENGCAGEMKFVALP